MTLWQLPAQEAADKIRSGEISSADLVEACLDHAEQTDEAIGAWAYRDRELALSQANEMDVLRRKGRALGSLHGVPVALAETFGTADLPSVPVMSANESRTAPADAAVQDRLREAGAVRLGNTAAKVIDSTTLADISNPRDPGRAAGTSAAGAAAAVAAGHVPLALSVQSDAAIINAASYCGIFGFKPSRGVISRRGCAETSASLDQIGAFGRSLEDIALLTDAVSGYDPADPASFARPRPRMGEGYRSLPPVEPLFAWIELPFLDTLPEATRAGFDELTEVLGERIEKVPAPKSFSQILNHHRTVQDYELSRRIAKDPRLDPGRLSPQLQEVLERAQAVAEKDYEFALSMMAGAEEFFETFFHDYDAILTPAAFGEAPKLGEASSDAKCATIWSFAGLPCLSAPWLASETGLPVGVQLIGSSEEDDRLFRTAAWLQRHLNEEA